MRFSILILAMAFAGCSSQRVPDHTLLYTADHQISIWSYQPVDGEGFVSRPLQANERVVLKGGAVVSFDGKHVAVNKQEVSDLNAVVESDGNVHHGAFIRTFD
jgi:hypothetical protein